MTQNIKIHPQLDPDFLLDVIITPDDQKDVEALVDYIQQSGGHLTRVDPGAISCRVPARQVSGLANAKGVAAVRLARLHHMH